MKASIIVSTFNRSGLLRRMLSSIAQQTFPVDQFEIIVVDTGSIDNTRATIDALIEDHPHNRIRYLYEPVPGNLAGRHRGALEAVGEFLVFVDDDIEAVPGWLAVIVDDFSDVKVQLIGGRSLPKYEIDPPTWIEKFWTSNFEAGQSGQYCWYLSLLDFGQKKFHMNPIHIWSLNFAIRRHTFFDLGGFHPDSFPEDLQHFSGDGESALITQAEARGLVAIYEPEATIYHFVPANRMTPGYFEKRAHAEGIRESYSWVRRNGLGGMALRTETRRLVCGIIRRARRLGRREKLVGRDEEEIKVLRKRFADAHQAGFEFHQRIIRLDPKVLHWVLRPSYWDYRLPR